jgi:argininosuccinate synthase
MTLLVLKTTPTSLLTPAFKAFLGNCGQAEDFAAVEKKALALGAERMVIDDLQQEFVDELIFRAIQCMFLQGRDYGTGIMERGLTPDRQRHLRGPVSSHKTPKHKVSESSLGVGKELYPALLSWPPRAKTAVDIFLELVLPGHCWRVPSYARPTSTIARLSATAVQAKGYVISPKSVRGLY